MESRAHALAAGFFIIVLCIAAAASVWWFSESREPMREYVLVTRGNITGLNLQAQVRYRGMAAGKVTDIVIDPDDYRNLLITISLREDMPVTKGTRASLGYQGVTGLAFVQLEDKGTDPTPLQAEGGALPRLALEPGFMDRLTDTALEMLDRVRDIADSVSKYFDDDSLQRMHSMLENIDSAAKGINDTFAQAPVALTSINKAFNDENLAKLSNTLANLERATSEATPAIADLRSTMAHADKLMVSLDDAAQITGNRIMRQTLPQLNRLLEELTNTSVRLGRLIEEVELSPQMLITGRSKARPGPGEAGFSSEEH